MKQVHAKIRVITSRAKVNNGAIIKAGWRKPTEKLHLRLQIVTKFCTAVCNGKINGIGGI